MYVEQTVADNTEIKKKTHGIEAMAASSLLNRDKQPKPKCFRPWIITPPPFFIDNLFKLTITI